MPEFNLGRFAGMLQPEEVRQLQDVYGKIASQPWFTRDPARQDQFGHYLFSHSRQGLMDLDRLEFEAMATARARFASDAGLTEPERRLVGQNVLVVEDEPLLAGDAIKKLRDVGATVVGPAATLGDALDMIEETELDVALLDIGLDDETVFPVATILMKKRVPFAFISGRDRPNVPGAFRHVPIFPKPADWTKVASYLVT